MTRTEKQSLGIKEIAVEVRKQYAKEFPDCTFSITIQRYSMGQSLHVYLMKAGFKVVQTPEDISEEAIRRYYRSAEQLKQNQTAGHFQISGYTDREYNPNVWNNGVFLTEAGHKLIQRMTAIVSEYNWDNSDAQTDYFDVHFYTHYNIGKYDKPFVQPVEIVKTKLQNFKFVINIEAEDTDNAISILDNKLKKQTPIEIFSISTDGSNSKLNNMEETK